MNGRAAVSAVIVKPVAKSPEHDATRTHHLYEGLSTVTPRTRLAETRNDGGYSRSDSSITTIPRQAPGSANVSYAKNTVPKKIPCPKEAGKAGQGSGWGSLPYTHTSSRPHGARSN